MRTQEYLVITSSGKSFRRIFWNTRKPLTLDHPRRWVLETTSGNGLRARQVKRKNETPQSIRIDLSEAGKHPLTLSDAKSGHPLSLRIFPLTPLRPAFVTKERPSKRLQRIIYCGAGESIFHCKRMGKIYLSALADVKFFELRRTVYGYQVTALVDGLTFQTAGKKTTPCKKSTSVFIDHQDVHTGVFKCWKYWWRVNRVPAPEQFTFPLDGKTAHGEDWVGRACKGILLSVFFLMMILPLVSRFIHKPKVVAKTEISLKEPKKIFAPPVVPPPLKIVPPVVPPIVKAEPKPIPAPALPAPLQPHNEDASPPRVASKPKPAKNTPPAPQERAVAVQQLAKSLTFLSPQAKRNAAKMPDFRENTFNSTQEVPTEKKEDSSFLERVADSNESGEIHTQSARNIQIPQEGGSAGDNVRARVSVSSLYGGKSGGTGEGPGSSLEGRGLSLSGEGTLSQQLVEKTLEKSLNKFQYCYEKALLSDGALAGTVLMQWMIRVDGEVSDVKVVRSELNQSELHACLTRELMKIHFPTPKGGTVIIKYPFSFSSGSL